MNTEQNAKNAVEIQLANRSRNGTVDFDISFRKTARLEELR